MIILKKWFVYIVNCIDNTFYTGITNNVKKRVETHNLGKGAKYTKTRRPVSVVYLEEYQNRSEASKREYVIKQLTRKQKLEMILNNSDNSLFN